MLNFSVLNYLVVLIACKKRFRYHVFIAGLLFIIFRHLSIFLCGFLIAQQSYLQKTASDSNYVLIPFFFCPNIIL